MLTKVNGVIFDSSGFGNNGIIVTSKENETAGDSLLLDKNCFVEISNACSLDHLDGTITMMAWVYPIKKSGGLVDFFYNGDNHVLQVVDNKQLSFFAGGWGGGDCTVPLPANWQNNCHHIAGVCDGRTLRLYIDGELKGARLLTETVNLSVASKWEIGRNEEFPSQRVFTGYMDKVKVFASALSPEEITAMMKR